MFNPCLTPIKLILSFDRKPGYHFYQCDDLSHTTKNSGLIWRYYINDHLLSSIFIFSYECKSDDDDDYPSQYFGYNFLPGANPIQENSS